MSLLGMPQRSHGTTALANDLFTNARCQCAYRRARPVRVMSIPLFVAAADVPGYLSGGLDAGLLGDRSGFLLGDCRNR